MAAPEPLDAELLESVFDLVRAGKARRWSDVDTGLTTLLQRTDGDGRIAYYALIGVRRLLYRLHKAGKVSADGSDFGAIVEGVGDPFLLDDVRKRMILVAFFNSLLEKGGETTDANSVDRLEGSLGWGAPILALSVLVDDESDIDLVREAVVEVVRKNPQGALRAMGSAARARHGSAERDS